MKGGKRKRKRTKELAIFSNQGHLSAQSTVNTSDY
jgi:hypothetical protein